MLKLQKFPNLSAFLLGGALALAFAPVFFLPATLTLAILAYQTKNAPSWKKAAQYGFLFGFGFFTFGLYWMAIGVSVYINDFWWAIPFALFGLPLVLAIFISIGSAISWHCRDKKYYILAFSSIWVILEWVRSWIFTGLPWNLLGYTLCFSDVLIQLASIAGTYGMSFLVIYISAGAIDLLNGKKRNGYFALFLLIAFSALLFGSMRLEKYKTTFSDIKIRIVQPNVPQTDKWDIDSFWEHLDSHIQLSNLDTSFKPDLIIWSEAAVTAPYTVPPVKKKLQSALMSPDTVLITGGVSEKQTEDKYDIYSAMYAINSAGDILFEYHKSHLVPFGEYMPLKTILPLKKLTPGIQDYTEGLGGQVVHLHNFDLKIRPLVCYESIFPGEVRHKDGNVLINITNDTWYGNSSGPYQHFQMARMRAVENGIPLVRVANSGISGMIDPVGRIISETKLGHKSVLDGLLPNKIADKPPYVAIGDFIAIIIVTLTHLLRKILDKALGSK